MQNNTATGNGGALYLSADAEVTTDNLDMQGNSAGGNGGAIYLQGMEMTLDSGDVFKNNTAGGHGGAIYLVYVTNKDNSRTGAVLNATDVVFDGNSAMAGGAISARSSCVVNLNGTTLTNNSVTGFQNIKTGALQVDHHEAADIHFIFHNKHFFHCSTPYVAQDFHS